MSKPIDTLRAYLTERGQGNRTDEILTAYRDGTLAEWLDRCGVGHLADTDMPRLLMLAHADEQYDQCRQWQTWLREAGYSVIFGYTDRQAPFDREWTVYASDGERIDIQVATFDIDGCGASWHGPDEIYSAVIGPREGVTD